MEKSVRIALIGFLIVLAYSTSIFIETGRIIIPFPLFSYLLLTVILATLIQDKLNWKSYIPIAVFVLLRCISNPFIYSIFMEEQAYYEVTSGLTFSVFRILETLSVFPLIFLTLGFNGVQGKVTCIAISSVFILTLIPPFDMLNYAFFTILFLTAVYQKKTKQSFPILLLVAVFDLLEGYSVLLA